ncbi:MAG TPA: GNA1162 family protein, partial [Planctomycetota bacterium]|nr:GNA1162 family protein [Planctomycetota bacterium]
LPPDNWTMDVGVEYITWYRAVIHELLKEKGYDVAPLVEVNRFFRKNKFTVAGEVGVYSVAELARQFNVDAILYWAVTSDSPRLMFSLEKADGTLLWCTGEVALVLSHVAHVEGRFNPYDGGMALGLGEILRHMPGRRP